MARFRKPFFKKSHACWYVQLDGKQVRLCPDKDEAHERYHALMRERKRAARFATPGEPTPVTLGDVLDQYLAWLKSRETKSGPNRDAGAPDADRGPTATRLWYEGKLNPLVSHLGREFPAGELKPFQIDQWVAAHPDWAPGTVRNVWRAVQRLCRWGYKKGLLPELSLVHQEKPRGGRRTVVISPEEYRLLLTWVRNDCFRALLVVCWETAARPQEILRARVRHLDRGNKRLVFPPDESKDQDQARVVYLTDQAFGLLDPAPGAGPEEHLLRNSEGRPWTTDAVNCAFAALHKRMTKAGVACRKFCLYHFRHSWLDRKLKGSVDALTCAVLMGHKDPSTIAKTYQHLSQSPDYLRGELNKEPG